MSQFDAPNHSATIVIYNWPTVHQGLIFNRHVYPEQNIRPSDYDRMMLLRVLCRSTP